MSSRESSINPTAAEVTSSSAPKSDPAAEDVADTLAPEEKCKQTADTKFIYVSMLLIGTTLLFSRK